MSLHTAIQRFSWRLSNGNFKPVAKDVECFNEIIEWINKEKETRLNHNRLFAKLYLERLAKEIVFCKSDYQEAQERLHRMLVIPLERYYESFSNEMKYNNISNYCESIGIDKPLVWMNEKNKTQALKELEPDVFKSIVSSEYWNLEKTTDRLNDLLTDALNKYSDLP